MPANAEKIRASRPAPASYLFQARRLALICDLPAEKPSDGVFRGRVKCINRPRNKAAAIMRRAGELGPPRRVGEFRGRARNGSVINAFARMKEETFRECFRASATWDYLMRRLRAVERRAV